jgi:hypothetical protein
MLMRGRAQFAAYGRQSAGMNRGFAVSIDGLVLCAKQFGRASLAWPRCLHPVR